MSQVVHLVAKVSRHGKGRKLGTDQAEIKGEMRAQIGGPFDCSRITTEPLRHLTRGLQKSLIGARQIAIGADQVPSAGHGRQHVGQVGVTAYGVMDLVRGNRRDPQSARQLPQQVVSLVVAWDPVMPDLEMQTVAEQVPQFVRSRQGSRKVTPGRSTGDGSLPAGGQGMYTRVSCRLGQIRPGIDGPVLFASHLGTSHQSGKNGVGTGRSGEKNQMVCCLAVSGFGPVMASRPTSSADRLVAFGAGDIPRLGSGDRFRVTGGVPVESDLYPVDHRHAEMTGGLHDLDRPVEAVVVRDSQRGVSQLRGARHQLMRMGSPI